MQTIIPQRQFFFLVLTILTLLSLRSFAQCKQPPNTFLNLSWSPQALVQVDNDGTVPDGPLETALANWNQGLINRFDCNPPSFNTNFGQPTAFAHITYTSSIPQTCLSSNQVDTELEFNGTSIARGCTDLNNKMIDENGRIFSVNIYLATQVSAAAALTEVIAHEFGHTLALTDCIYKRDGTGCPIGSSVMVSQASVGINGTEGQPGPTQCDLDAAAGITTDYLCSGGGNGGDCTFVPGPTGRFTTTDPGGDPPPCNCPPGQTCIGPGTGSPIIVDTEAEGFHLTSVEQGVMFDIAGDGHPVAIAWTDSRFHNAFLALPGPDGLVHNGKQLFGNFTPQPPSATPNGFIALAEYDKPEKGGNGDGIIDGRNQVFSRLRLWIDDNHDGICQANELHSLVELSVYSLAFNYLESRRKDEFANQFRYKARINPGESRDHRDETPSGDPGRWAYDVFFIVK